MQITQRCDEFHILELNSVHCWYQHQSTCCREDLQNLPMGRKLMQHIHIKDHELVARPGLWHSSAQVIEGSFRLLPSETHCIGTAAQQDKNKSHTDIYWCNKSWDPAAGRLLDNVEESLPSRKAYSLSSKFILA